MDSLTDNPADRLIFWRTAHPTTLLRAPDLRQALRTTLLPVTPRTDKGESPTLAASASAGIRLAHGLARAGGASDVVGSWLLWAALDNQPDADVARVLLASHLDRDRETDRLFRRCPNQQTRLARRWLALVRCVPALGKRDGKLKTWVQSWAEAFPALAAEVAPATEEVDLGDIPMVPPNTPSLTVLDRIGDGGPERERTALEAQYARLLHPLPLAGTSLDPDRLATALALEFPWMQEPIGVIHQEMTLRHRAGQPWLALSPLLLVGPPGTGKTRFARKLARLAGTGYGEMSVGGSSDNRALQGTARGWGSTQPAFPLLTINRTETGNPVIVLDELDKVQSSHNGSLQQTLLGLIEPETARGWHDECLLGHADLSHVSWICTANDLSSLPGPLLSRMHVVPVDRPRPEHAATLLSGLERDFAQEFDLPADQLRLAEEARNALEQALREGTDIRRVQRAFRAALAADHGRPLIH